MAAGAGAGRGWVAGSGQAGGRQATCWRRDGIAALQTKSCSISFVCCYISKGKRVRMPLYEASRAGNALQTPVDAYMKIYTFFFIVEQFDIFEVFFSHVTLLC